MDIALENFFAQATVTDKGKLRKLSGLSPIVIDCENPDVVLVIAQHPNEEEMKQLQFALSVIRSHLMISRVRVVAAVVDIHKDKITSMLKHFLDYRVDLSEYIPKRSKFVTVGSALMATTASSNLHVYGFYDIVFNAEYFYHPDLESWIYPIPDFWEWIRYSKVNGNYSLLDNWEKFFSLRQIKRADQAAHPVIQKEELKLVEIPSGQFLDFLKATAQNPIVAVDTETSGLYFMKNHLGCVTMSFDGVTGYYVDWSDVDVQAFGEWLKPKQQIYANGKFDCKFFLKAGIPRDCLHIDHDIVCMGHVCNELSSSSLKALTWIYTTHGGYDFEMKNLDKAVGGFLGVPRDKLIRYATLDAIMTFKVYAAAKEHIHQIDHNFPMGPDSDWSLWKYYYEIMIPAQNTFLDIEYNGMRIDKDELARLNVSMLKRLADTKAELLRELASPDPDFNLGSIEQLGKLLESKGWKNYGKTKKGFYQTNTDILKTWAEKDGHRAAQLLLEYRELDKLNSTYIGNETDQSGFHKYLCEHGQHDFRVHSSYSVMLADTGRGRSSDPNLQNIPKQGTWAKTLRRYFKPPTDDYYLAEWDAKGLQLRIVGILSGDTAMRRAFMDPVIGGDLHSVTGQAVFMRDVSLEEFLAKVEAEEEPYCTFRQKSKAVNFSLVFNTTSSSLAEASLKLEWTMQECIDYVAKHMLEDKRKYLLDLLMKKGNHMSEGMTQEDKENFSYYWAVAQDIKIKFFEKYPGVQTWIDESLKLAESQGYIRSPFGAIRRLPQLLYRGNDALYSKVKNMQNMAVNSPVQNYEAVVIMRAMTIISKALKRRGMLSQVVGNVHDSCVMYIHKSELDEVYNLIERAFVTPLPENKGIPMGFDLSYADYTDPEQCWAFGKKYKKKKVEASN